MQSAKRPDFGKISADRKIQNEKENSQKNAKRECERTEKNLRIRINSAFEGYQGSI